MGVRTSNVVSASNVCDRSERGHLIETRHPGLSAREKMKAHASVDDHLSVEMVEGADPEVAVLQQFGDGDRPVVDTVEER